MKRFGLDPIGRHAERIVRSRHRWRLAFGGSAESWLNQQALYSFAQTRQKMGTIHVRRWAVA